MNQSLDADELAIWHAFKRAGETVRARIGADIAHATGLSDPDYGILTRLDDAGGRLRQNELAASLHWHRSRLSHQLTRMADRGLVTRDGGGPGVDAVITAAGRAIVARARPAHAAAVRSHLLGVIPAEDRAQFLHVLRQLAGQGRA